MHAAPRHIQCPAFSWGSPVVGDPNAESFVQQAATSAWSLPANVQAQVRDFRERSHVSGAALIRGLPIGRLSPTPLEPTWPTSKDQISERTLLSVATLLGEPVGYRPELGGRLVQNLVPTRAGSDKQISTSSSVQLLFHTETAFHPYRPEYLLLLCLRGDAAAETTLSSIQEIMSDLSSDTIEILFQPRFRIGIDESFLNGRQNVLGPRISVLSGDLAAPTMVFDEDLMVATDPAAAAALSALQAAAARRHTGVTLESGDLLIIDNARAVHGRSPYKPRFDGTDRWLQRTFVVERLPTSPEDLEGRVIKTEFGTLPAQTPAVC